MMNSINLELEIDKVLSGVSYLEKRYDWRYNLNNEKDIISISDYYIFLTVSDRDENGMEKHSKIDMELLSENVKNFITNKENYKRVNFGSYGDNSSVYRNILEISIEDFKQL